MRQFGGLDELVARAEAVERLEVGVAQPDDVGTSGRQLEPMDERPHRHHQGVERVRDAAVAPVEEQVAAVANEDVSVVEVVVLDRLRDAVGREACAARGEVGDERPESLVLVLVEAVLPADHARVPVVEQGGDVARQDGEALVRDLRLQQLVDCAARVRSGALRTRAGAPASG